MIIQKRVRNQVIEEVHTSYVYTQKEIVDILGLHYIIVSKVVSVKSKSDFSRPDPPFSSLFFHRRLFAQH